MMTLRTYGREYGKDVYDFGVSHIDGIILSEDSMKPTLSIEESKGYFDNLRTAYTFLDKQFADNGLYFGDKRRESYVVIREKFGDFRINGTLYNPDDLNIFRTTIKNTLVKFPQVAPYLVVNPSDKTILFTGTHSDFDKWFKKLKSNDLEMKLKNILAKKE